MNKTPSKNGSCSQWRINGKGRHTLKPSFPNLHQAYVKIENFYRNI